MRLPAKSWSQVARYYLKFEYGRMPILLMALVTTIPGPWFWFSHVALTFVFLVIAYLLSDERRDRRKT